MPQEDTRPRCDANGVTAECRKGANGTAVHISMCTEVMYICLAKVSDRGLTFRLVVKDISFLFIF